MGVYIVPATLLVKKLELLRSIVMDRLDNNNAYDMFNIIGFVLTFIH